MTTPTRPGQAVRSLLDNRTVGVTITAPRPHPCGERVTVMFIGSHTDTPFHVYNLEVIDLTEPGRTDTRLDERA